MHRYLLELNAFPFYPNHPDDCRDAKTFFCNQLYNR